MILDFIFIFWPLFNSFGIILLFFLGGGILAKFWTSDFFLNIFFLVPKFSQTFNPKKTKLDKNILLRIACFSLEGKKIIQSV